MAVLSGDVRIQYTQYITLFKLRDGVAEQLSATKGVAVVGKSYIQGTL